MNSSFLSPTMYLGMSHNVIGNGQFVSNDSTLHICGNLLILGNLLLKSQKLIKHPTSSGVVNMMSLCPQNCHLALAEKGKKPSISVYSLTNYQRLVVLGNPLRKSTCRKFCSVHFVMEDKRIIALLGKPDWVFITYAWEIARVLIVTRACYTNLVTTISDVLVNHYDSSVIAVVGRGTLRYMNLLGGLWRQFGYHKVGSIFITTACWVSIERILVGTSRGKLILFSYTGLLAVFNAHSVLFMDIEDPISSNENSNKPLIKNKRHRNGVFFLKQYKKWLVYSCKYDTVHVFHRISINNKINSITKFQDSENELNMSIYFQRSHILKVPSASSTYIRNRLSSIISISINQDGEFIVCGTKGSQFLISSLINKRDQKDKIYFRLINCGINRHAISCIGSCIWKPLFLSTANDKTLKLYDYYRNDVFIMKQFKKKINFICLHPTGSFGILGFIDKILFFSIHDFCFQPLHEIIIKEAKLCVFSSEGALFAVVAGSSIIIFDSMKFHPIYNIKEAYALTITVLMFDSSQDFIWIQLLGDLIYKLDISNGNTVFSMRICDAIKFVMDNEFKYFYTIGSGGSISAVEISTQRITWVKHFKDGTPNDLLIPKNNRCMFIGMKKGSIRLLHHPFDSSSKLDEYRIHFDSLKKMALAPDSSHLLTSGKDGGLCLWRVFGEAGMTTLRNNIVGIINRECIFERKRSSYYNKLLYVLDIDKKMGVHMNTVAFLHVLQTQEWNMNSPIKTINLFEKVKKVGLYFPKYVCKAADCYKNFRDLCIRAVRGSLVTAITIYDEFKDVSEISEKRKKELKIENIRFVEMIKCMFKFMNLHLHWYRMYADDICQEFLAYNQEFISFFSLSSDLKHFQKRSSLSQSRSIFRRIMLMDQYYFNFYLSSRQIKLVSNYFYKCASIILTKKIKNMVETAMLMTKNHYDNTRSGSFHNICLDSSLENENDSICSFHEEKKISYDMAKDAYAKVSRHFPKHFTEERNPYPLFSLDNN